MFFKKILLYFLLIFLFNKDVYANQPVETVSDVKNEWSFYKVSKNDLFNQKNKDVIESLTTLYEQVKISVSDNVLTINNFLIDGSQVCSIEYIRLKKTPLEYFYSQKTVDLYSILFSQEHVLLENEIYILTSSDPNKECYSPYNEIIENDGYLVIIDQDHLLFFKQDLEKDKKYQFQNEFPNYCKKINEKKVFDGSEQYSCIYPDKKLLDTYIRIKHILKNGQFMKDTLPQEDSSFVIDGGKVVYQWVKPNLLHLVIEQGAENTTYIFEEKNNSTSLMITVDTGY